MAKRLKEHMDGERSFPLTSLYVYLTQHCNLRCRHCWIVPTFDPDGGPQPSLDFDLFRSIVTQAKPLGLVEVKLTGGEPLLHPNIAEILGYIRAQDLRLVVETNGTCCTPELAEMIRACKSAHVSVSIDAADPETHEWVRGVPGCFARAMDGLTALVNVGLRPQVILTVMRRNKGEMEAVVRMSEALGAGSVRFNIVQPAGRGFAMHRESETLDIDDLVKLGQWVETELALTSRIHVSFSHPPAFRPLSRIFGPDGDGCSVCRILGILGVLGDGRYALCGIGQTETDLIFGDARHDALEQVWNDSPVLRQLREGLPSRLEGVCRHCVLKHICLGSCLAQNYLSKRSLWAPFWYCEEANLRGLFPETRLIPDRSGGEIDAQLLART